MLVVVSGTSFPQIFEVLRFFSTRFDIELQLDSRRAAKLFEASIRLVAKRLPEIAATLPRSRREYFAALNAQQAATCFRPADLSTISAEAKV